ncbi:MAG: DNA methyltransferase [Candidatus Gastranaerophilaceae bacterium]
MEQGKNGFYLELLNVLKQDSKKRFYADNGDLLRNKVAECAMNLDKGLIKLLLSNDKVKNKFFTKVDDLLIFDKMAFIWAVNNKAFLKDSYTRFKNNIGLIDGHEQFLSSKNDVVLSFPYKDCILEGGQTKEDQKRQEIYYNELLAPDDIDKLLAPKVFTNAKRYTKNGIQNNITDFNDKDNLLIKGNNLLALSSILKRYEGKVKCIYIDPPFNTDKDSFKYNDSFNQSTWLVFMKNRLELAKKLLANNGSILVHLDFNESHYCKILMDEIFGKDNFKNNIVWCYTGPAGATDFLPRKHDDILFYGKTKESKIKMPYITHKSGVHNTGQLFGSTETNKTFKEEIEARGKKLEDWWIDIYSTDRYRRELVGFSGQKPEKLLQRVIEMCTDEQDIVLDFHFGTGTTGAVAQKINRQWIGIEQLNYGEIDSVKRIEKVIKGDTTGISKDVNWQGGGSFVYCELKELNQKFVDEIKIANDKKLNELYNSIINSEFISYKAEINKLKDSEQEFEQLSIDDKKKFLIEVLDKNMLYVNYCDIDDNDFEITEQEKAFTKSFYGDK